MLFAASLLASSVAIGLSLTTLNNIRQAVGSIYSDYSNLHLLGLNELNEYIKRIDLTRHLEILDSILKKVVINSPSIDMAVLSIKEAVDEINEQLKSMKERIEYNSKLWIKLPYRAYRFYNLTERLRKAFELLKEREKTLKMTLQLIKT